jgi:hypothetical protein
MFNLFVLVFMIFFIVVTSQIVWAAYKQMFALYKAYYGLDFEKRKNSAKRKNDEMIKNKKRIAEQLYIDRPANFGQASRRSALLWEFYTVINYHFDRMNRRYTTVNDDPDTYIAQERILQILRNWITVENKYRDELLEDQTEWESRYPHPSPMIPNAHELNTLLDKRSPIYYDKDWINQYKSNIEQGHGYWYYGDYDISG